MYISRWSNWQTGVKRHKGSTDPKDIVVITADPMGIAADPVGIAAELKDPTISS